MMLIRVKINYNVPPTPPPPHRALPVPPSILSWEEIGSVMSPTAPFFPKPLTNHMVLWYNLRGPGTDLRIICLGDFYLSNLAPIPLLKLSASGRIPAFPEKLSSPITIMIATHNIENRSKHPAKV